MTSLPSRHCDALDIGVTVHVYGGISAHVVLGRMLGRMLGVRPNLERIPSTFRRNLSAQAVSSQAWSRLGAYSYLENNQAVPSAYFSVFDLQ